MNIFEHLLGNCLEETKEDPAPRLEELVEVSLLPEFGREQKLPEVLCLIAFVPSAAHAQHTLLIPLYDTMT